MNSHLLPDWADTSKPLYDVVASAREKNVSTDALVEALQQERFPNAPARRIQSIVETTEEIEVTYEGPTTDSSAAGNAVPETQNESPAPETYNKSSKDTRDAAQRLDLSRRLDLSDLRRVTRGEFAQLCRPLLERFDGNTIIPHHPTIDVLWHRRHGTVGAQVIPGSPKETLSVERVRELSNADTSVDNHRTPSELAIVTPQRTDEEVSKAATEMDITLVAAPRLAQWLRITPLPPKVVGNILENSHSSDFEVAETLESLPALPARWADADPMGMSILPAAHVDAGMSIVHGDSPTQQSATTTTNKRSSTETTHTEKQSTAEDSSTTTDSSNSRDDSEGSDSQKEYGTLYADPDEDGDYDGIDAWADGINTEDKP